MLKEVTTFRRPPGSSVAIVLFTAVACLSLFVAAGARADNFKVLSFTAGALNDDGTASTAAGARPFEVENSFEFDTTVREGVTGPAANVRDVDFRLPPGSVANAAAFPQCKQAQNFNACPVESRIGTATATVSYFGGAKVVLGNQPVYNMEPPKGMPAQFAFPVLFVIVHVNFHIRSDSDYGATAKVRNLNMAAPVFASKVQIWGVPADPSHDAERGGPYPSTDLQPFLSNPTSCETPQTFSLTVTSWQFPNEDIFGAPVQRPAMSGCDRLNFDPSIKATPTTNLADSPSGLGFHLHLPQPEEVTRTETEIPAVNERQSLSILATEGQFKLGFGGEQTADLPFDASAASIEGALVGLASIGAGNIAVSGGSGDEIGSAPYAIVFQGALAGTDVEQISAEGGTVPLEITNGSGTSSGSAGVSTTTPGAAAFVKHGVDAEPAEANLRESKVVLPPGLVVNPSSANGLGACTPAQIGMTTPVGQADAHFTDAPANCPEDAKLGTVRIDSPAALDHPLQGTVYLASQAQNPFGSLLAIYITVNDPKSGIVLKLPGLIEADPKTGQLTATVSEAPQLPFEDLELSFFKGNGAPLKTGIACGTYEIQTDMVPWTSPEGATKHPSDSFSIDKGCAKDEASAPNAPSFEAGTADPKAGAYSPFTLKLTRADGTQQLTGIDTVLPKGLIAKLAGVPYCPDAALASAAGKSGKDEQASPSCPAASEVGSVTVGAGAGPTPFYAPGSAYLAGPYKGAPLSLAVVTPAVAGPFDLGTVVVRNALYVNPESAEVHAVSDPFPHILQGIPLDLRSVVLNLDRPSFTKNPTNCAPLAFTGFAMALTGQSSPLEQRFQVGDCAKLKFSPKLALSLHGQTKRTGNPALTAVLKMPPGQANIAKTRVMLPASQFIDNSHINNPCTRVQFNAGACPPASILGTARAFTPLLDQPLEGPVYFRSNGGERDLPDLVADLNGQIHVTLVGFIDSVPIKGTEKARVRTTFANVPDAPVSKFVLRLHGGKRGLIENSKNLCKGIGPASVQFDGQNGKPYDFDTKLGTSCGAKKKGKGQRPKRSMR